MKKIFSLSSILFSTLLTLSGNDIEITAYAPIHPILKGLEVNPFIKITITVPESSESLKNPVFLATTSESSLPWIESVGIFDASESLLKKINIQHQQFEISLDTVLSVGSHQFILGLNPNGLAPITGSFEMHCHSA